MEIVKQYNREKEILPANDPNKVVLAKELIDKSIVRFCLVNWEVQDELGDLNRISYSRTKRFVQKLNG